MQTLQENAQYIVHEYIGAEKPHEECETRVHVGGGG